MDGIGHACFAARAVAFVKPVENQKNNVDKQLAFQRMQEIKHLKGKIDGLENYIAKLLRELSTYKERTWYYLPLSEIIDLACEYYQFSKARMLSPCRPGELVRARHVSIYCCRNNTIQSLPQIGRAFGGRDHTSILHACKKIEKLRKLDNQLNTEIVEIERKIAQRLIEREQNSNNELLHAPLAGAAGEPLHQSPQTTNPE